MKRIWKNRSLKNTGLEVIYRTRIKTEFAHHGMVFLCCLYKFYVPFLRECILCRALCLIAKMGEKGDESAFLFDDFSVFGRSSSMTTPIGSLNKIGMDLFLR